MKTFSGMLLIAALLTPGGETMCQQEPWRLFSILGGADLPAGEPVKCGFPITARARGMRSALAPSQRIALQTLTARTPMQKSRASGAFRVHYDTTGNNAPALLNGAHQVIVGSAEAYVDSVLSIARSVFSAETATLGYAVPPSDNGLGGGEEYDIYVLELGNLYGDTTPDIDVNEGGRCSSFIRIDNDFTFVTPDSNKGLPALRVTLAHEMHHLIQLGSYGFWFNDVYYYEMTSTWMEDVLYTGVNDYYNYLRRWWSHFQNPQTRFASGSSLIMYSRGIWGQYVQERFGLATMRSSWQHMATSRPLPAIDAALREVNSSLPEAFADWAVWNHFTGYRADTAYYPEGAAYPLMVESPVGVSTSVRNIPDSLPPLSARYYQVPNGSDTVTIAVVNSDASRAAEGWENATPYTLSISLTRVDGTYADAGAGVYAKLMVVDPSRWRMWFILGKAIDPGIAVNLSEGTPFPSPFIADGQSVVRIPLSVAEELTGSMRVYDAAMGLLRSVQVRSHLFLGRQVVEWDGRADDGTLAPSGVYLFVLDVSGRTIMGKLALVRR